MPVGVAPAAREAVVTRTLLLTGLRDLARRPLHTGLMVLGVALGVAVVIAIDLANTQRAAGVRAQHRGRDGTGDPPGARRAERRAAGPVPPRPDRGRAAREHAGRRGLRDRRRPRPPAAARARPRPALGRAVPRPPRRRLAGASPDSRACSWTRAPWSIGSTLADRYGLRSARRCASRCRDATSDARGRGHRPRGRRRRGRRARVRGAAWTSGAAQALFALGDHVTRVDLIATRGRARARAARCCPPACASRRPASRRRRSAS